MDNFLFDDRFVGQFLTRRERFEEMGDRAKKYTNVYVKNFADQLDDQSLLTQFSQCGTVISCKVHLIVSLFFNKMSACYA